MALDATRTPGQSIGIYDLVEKIAEGGMGAVFRARRRDNGEVVAIKVMPAHMARNEVLLKRFEQEFRAASRLDHPNVVRALDYGDSGDTPYLVMEFVDGESLGQRIQREGPLSEVEAIRVIAQVAQGLHRAHKMGLVHRDVKPDNIMITRDGTAKLADLGLVKELDTDLNLTRTGRGLGTPHFMAPEQFRNAKNVDPRCDIYALGATLYQMVTGELPFRSSGPLDAWMKKMHNELTPPRQINPGLSERIDWAIRRSMSADAEQRPASCREFVEDLTGRSTRKVSGPTSGEPAVQDLWFLVYKDEEGVSHTVKGSVAAVRRSLKDGLLGDASNIRASRVKTGPFEPLRGYPEFRDLVVAPAPLNLPASNAPTTEVPSAVDNSTSSLEETPIPRPVASARPKNQAASPSRSPSPPAGERGKMPHIDLQFSPPPAPKNREWLKWLLLVLMALATAIVTFFFLWW